MERVSFLVNQPRVRGVRDRCPCVFTSLRLPPNDSADVLARQQGHRRSQRRDEDLVTGLLLNAELPCKHQVDAWRQPLQLEPALVAKLAGRALESKASMDLRYHRHSERDPTRKSDFIQ